MSDAKTLILVGLFVLMFILVILLVKNRQYNKKKIVTLRTNNPQEFTNFMKEHDFPEEMIQHMQDGNVNVSSTKTIRKVKYINGQKVSDETETTTQGFPPLTNCRNCGASLDENGTCHYCNAKFIR